MIRYTGCGCAGGLVTTTESESLSQYSSPGVLVGAGRRKQKTYADILGRTRKAEVFNPNGSVYSTVVSKFNERDQVLETKHYQGSDSSGVFQTTLSSFDGHGRLKQSRVPEFTIGTYAEWTYNADDSTQSVTDPRGAAVHYAYNDLRGLLTGISYSVPQGSGITMTPSVSFTFDNAGNRTSMSDGTGTVNYAYDQLSRLQSETRSFTGVSGSFSIGYTYHLGGSLKSVFDPADSTRTVNYAYQKTGELSTMIGNSGTLVENRKITAFGGLKQEDYGNGFKLRHTFDDRLRLSEYRVKNANEQSVAATTFEYNAGNEVIRANGAYHFDRYYNYDHVGRFSGNFTAWTGNTDYISYDGGAGYDVWNNMTGRSSNIWGYNSTVTSVYQNNRITQVQPWNSHSGQSPIQYWQYDAAGNATVSGGQNHWYDAAGRKIRSIEETPEQQRAAIDIEQTYDGDGRIIKRHEFQVISMGPNITKTEYGLWSSVLGVEVAKVSPAGVRGPDSFFDPSGRKIATMGTAGTKYHHETPFTGSSFETIGQANYVEERQFDPFGGEIPSTEPPSPIPDWIPVGNYQQTGNPLDLQGGCMLSGLPEDCATVAKVSSAHRRDKFRGRSGSEPFPWDAEHRNLPSRIGNWDPRHPMWIPGLDGTPTMASIETFESGGEYSYAYRYVRRVRGSRSPQQFKDVNVNCLDALAAANQDYEAVKRALNYQTELENAVRNHRNVSGTENFRNAFPWQMLAAIGVRETGFQNRSEIGGGGGQGVFQITGANVSQEILDSVEKSAGWILANRIEPSYVESHVRTLGHAVLWTLRNYNAGGGSAWGYSKSKELARSGNLNALDWDYGTAYPGMNTRNRDEADLKKGNYVSNVIRIATYCFGYNPGGHFSY